MAKMRIVTDGAADIPAELARELGIEVVPLVFEVDDKSYRAGVDMADEQAYELLAGGQSRLKAHGPTSGQIEQIYRRLIGDYDYIFSIHLSGRLGGVHASAAQAKARLPASTTRVELIDSKSASMGMGSVVLAAARAIGEGAAPDEVSTLIHAMIRHTHAVFFVDTMEYLEASGKLQIAGAVLGSMQRIKPLMILDEGEVVPYERTRTRAKAIEGLFTFVEDFPRVEEVIALYATTPEDIEKLLEKLDPIFPRDRVQIARFGPGIAAHLGPGAMGVVVFEGIEED